MIASATYAKTCNFVTKWGSFGSGTGQCTYQTGVAVDSSGNVYVAETGYSRIQKFAPNFVGFPSIIVPIAAILVLTVIFRRKKW
ncbi:hypothetical protein [Methanosarcina siciliae]|uniref:hypothetical protein n=1 Tax=Methanosarcina siciliae TaxID=38027 RepID=UPI000AC5A81B|nr:hypothetical protein [Methanosarcina siciliae]